MSLVFLFYYTFCRYFFLSFCVVVCVKLLNTDYVVSFVCLQMTFYHVSVCPAVALNLRVLAY